MACKELAALRLGLMRTIGIDDEAERQHELGELGAEANQAGPLRSMCEAGSLLALKQSYDASVSRLEEALAKTEADDAKIPYLRTLLVTTKKVELDLANQVESLTKFYRDLDQIHDFIHEIYPAK
ncbi:MAG TPA: DUF3209 family protein [Candidatus Angelobacter sp.]|nr:DUF3209 family protein [Candidatus Angelobacter sp.]